MLCVCVCVQQSVINSSALDDLKPAVLPALLQMVVRHDFFILAVDVEDQTELCFYRRVKMVRIGLLSKRIIK